MKELNLIKSLNEELFTAVNNYMLACHNDFRKHPNYEEQMKKSVNYMKKAVNSYTDNQLIVFSDLKTQNIKLED